MSIDDVQRVEVTSREDWRAWLAANHAHAEGVWLVTYKQHVPEKYFPYADKVEEALCFGWIDSRTRRVDDERSMLYFTARKAGSPWTKVNKRLVARLIKEGKMQPAGHALIDAAKADGSWTVFDEIEELVVPPDLAAALAGNNAARENYEAFSRSAKKIILWWIKTAKRQATRDTRIAETVRLAAKNVRAAHPEAQGQ